MKILIPFELPSIQAQQLVQLVKARTAFELQDLVALTCHHWDDLHIFDPSDLYDRLEWLVTNQPISERVNYHSVRRNINKLIDAVGVVYNLIEPSVEEIVDAHFPDQRVTLRLLGWNCQTPIIEVRSLSEPQDAHDPQFCFAPVGYPYR